MLPIETGNPFLEDQCFIAPIESLAAHKTFAPACMEVGWDLVIADEAHHIDCDPEQPGEDGKLLEALAYRASGLLLLTATPEQLGREAHFARLRLIDPARFHSWQAYQDERKMYQVTAEKAGELLKTGDRIALAELLDREGTGRIQFRNTRQALTERNPERSFPKREVHPTLVEDKFAWLLDLMQKLDRREKILLITSNRQTVCELETQLKEKYGSLHRSVSRRPHTPPAGPQCSLVFGGRRSPIVAVLRDWGRRAQFPILPSPGALGSAHGP